MRGHSGSSGEAAARDVFKLAVIAFWHGRNSCKAIAAEPTRMTSPTAETTTILRGRTLGFRDDPFLVEPAAAVISHEDGAVAIAGGKILAVGAAGDVIRAHPGAGVESYPHHIIMAGFVDCHAHYPQTGIIASYGAQLLEWLTKYTFPEEARFGDPRYAERIANQFIGELLRNGTTTVSAYCTSHPVSVDAFFTAAQARGMCVAAGKVMMDRNAPDGVLDTAQRGYDESKALLTRWHGQDRLAYVVTPRFAITSTPAQLEAAGALWREHPAALMQTHLSENAREIAWVRDLYPDAPDYLGVYERYGLLGPGANFGHAIHLSQREFAALAETGSGISHCPTSNLFIGSGLFDIDAARGRVTPIAVGLGTDIGGGSSFSMLQTMKASYEICQLQGYSLHPAKAFWLATLGGAQVMRMADRIGNLAPGYDADIAVLDLHSTPLIAERTRRAGEIWEALFVQMVLGDDRAIAATYVGGRKVHSRDA
jgi:guanine deaminase